MRLFWVWDKSSVRLHESSHLAALSILIDDIPVGRAGIFHPAAVYCSLSDAQLSAFTPQLNWEQQ